MNKVVAVISALILGALIYGYGLVNIFGLAVILFLIVLCLGSDLL